MSLKILQGELFAILPEKLHAICEVVESHHAGQPLAYTGEKKRGARSDEPYEVRDGVAIFTMYGVMGRRLSAFEEICGGCSCQTLIKHINHAKSNPNIIAGFMDSDSPGGVVAGVEELTAAIKSFIEEKPMVAFTGGQMCSAAYWTSSRATKIVATKAAVVGSIGVFAVHHDESAKKKAEGITRTIIKSGAYKATMAEPLTEDRLAYMQNHVQAVYDTFVEAVAEHRGIETSAVHPAMADGKIFTGKQALSAGLIDHIGDMEFALNLAGELAENFTQEKNMPTEGTKRKAAEQSINYAALTVDGLKAHAPNLLKAIASEATNNSNLIVSADAEKAVTEATAAERARVTEIIKSGASADLVLKAVEGGNDANTIYKDMVQAMKEGKGNALASMENGIGGPIEPKGEEKTPEGGDKKLEYEALYKDYMKAEGCTKGEAMKAIAREYPKAHAAWINK